MSGSYWGSGAGGWDVGWCCGDCCTLLATLVTGGVCCIIGGWVVTPWGTIVICAGMGPCGGIIICGPIGVVEGGAPGCWGNGAPGGIEGIDAGTEKWHDVKQILLNWKKTKAQIF